MKLYTAKSLDELESLIAELGNDALFRGQSTHFGDLGKPSVQTSFDRRGCIPSEMLKWSRYARNVLDVFIGRRDNHLDFEQALLQHYGWRSFYIDCSADPSVAAWFASHSYSDRATIEMSEDCTERPVWLRKRMARYDFKQGEGHLYVLDKMAAARCGLIDLAALSIEGFRPRTAAQAAWLIGPLRNAPVPIECFRAQITADRGLLRDYAASHGKTDTNALFPPASDDPILDALLGLPWREIEAARDSKIQIPSMKRALDLPEYHESYVKIAWPRTAFFRGAKIVETFKSIDGDPVGGISVNVPNIVLFGSADKATPMLFPNVEALISKHGTVAFEIDELIQHANMGHLTMYQKGIGVIPRADDLFEICELLVEHPGLEMTRAGFNTGWFYRRGTNGMWLREAHVDECPCGDAHVHNQHVSALHIAEAFLREPSSFEL
ncbi:FRG domain-containing protein [Rhizorhabdus dicambivorans]|uniref:FRG domain-containing protein n=1 Tax=Rhizorhabdus dicambivorans TaxID=1850238 RepID=A0A2A4FYT7_9SPHN|nr:FRG domain-containing protein [Rhizorhabdus dicambivorans]ATE67110.1 FRG domain-containing protein [Rhizorhabdus dicambivorans]PCE42895.1 FRG domain-containing protein [Rhizorhabdus dicambivorans]